MPNKLKLQIESDSPEELTNVISQVSNQLNGNGNENKQLANLEDELQNLRVQYSNIVAIAHQNKLDIQQHATELNEMAGHINELTADKLNKDLGVSSKLFRLINIDTPDPVPQGNVLPDWQNNINLWEMGLTVNLIPVSDDAHLYFITIGNTTYPIVITKYSNSSDPIRLTPFDVTIGLKSNALEFSLTGRNANLEMLVNTNPADVPSIRLIRFL